MDVHIRGTFNEIQALELFTQEQLCRILCIDPYRLCMVDCDVEIFTITHAMIIASRT